MTARGAVSAVTSKLLPRTGYGAWIACEDSRLERTNIDAQLQSIGADHTEDFARTQVPLNLSALLGQVTPAIRSDGLVWLSQLVKGLAQIGDEHLCIETASGKDNVGISAAISSWATASASKSELRLMPKGLFTTGGL